MDKDGIETINRRMEQLLDQGVPAAQVIATIRSEFDPTPEQFVLVCEEVMRLTGAGDNELNDAIMRSRPPGRAG